MEKTTKLERQREFTFTLVEVANFMLEVEGRKDVVLLKLSELGWMLDDILTHWAEQGEIESSEWFGYVNDDNYLKHSVCTPAWRREEVTA